MARTKKETIDLAGQRFGRLRVISKNSHNSKSGWKDFELKLYKADMSVFPWNMELIELKPLPYFDAQIFFKDYTKEEESIFDEED